jgi:hypothetical protein
MLLKLDISPLDEVEQARKRYMKDHCGDEFSFMDGIKEGIEIAERFYKEYDSKAQEKVKMLEEENLAMHTMIEGLVPLLSPNVKKQFKDMLLKDLEKGVKG